MSPFLLQWVHAWGHAHLQRLHGAVTALCAVPVAAQSHHLGQQVPRLCCSSIACFEGSWGDAAASKAFPIELAMSELWARVAALGPLLIFLFFKKKTRIVIYIPQWLVVPSALLFPPSPSLAPIGAHKSRPAGFWSLWATSDLTFLDEKHRVMVLYAQVPCIYGSSMKRSVWLNWVPGSSLWSVCTPSCSGYHSWNSTVLTLWLHVPAEYISNSYTRLYIYFFLRVKQPFYTKGTGMHHPWVRWTSLEVLPVGQQQQLSTEQQHCQECRNSSWRTLGVSAPSREPHMKCMPCIKCGVLCREPVLGNKPQPGLSARVCFLLMWRRAVAVAA